MEKTHHDHLHTRRPQASGLARYRIQINRDRSPIGTAPFLNLQPVFPGYQWLERLLKTLRTPTVPTSHLKQVSESRGGNQSASGALAFNQGIGGNSCTVKNGIALLKGYPAR